MNTLYAETDDIVLFGIQGSGKGTQAKILADKQGLVIFETGAELRKIMKEESELGKTVREIMERGDLVHNEIVMQIIEHFLSHHSLGQRILFDGIPRSMQQKDTFDALLKKNNRTIQGICLEVPREEVVLRMKSRGRADDTDTVIDRRIMNYEAETLPVILQYEKEGKILRINGFQEVGKVTEDIFTEIKRK